MVRRISILSVALALASGGQAVAGVTFTQKPAGIVDSQGYLHTADNPATFAWTANVPTTCSAASLGPDWTCTVKNVATQWNLITSAAGNAPGPEATPVTDTSGYSGKSTTGSASVSFPWAVNGSATLQITNTWNECVVHTTDGFTICPLKTDSLITPNRYDFFFDTTAATESQPPGTVTPSTPAPQDPAPDPCASDRAALRRANTALTKARARYRRHATKRNRRAVTAAKTRVKWAREQFAYCRSFDSP